MKIAHISNSFICIRTSDARIVCDPWVGSGNHGGWHSFPEYEKNDLIKLLTQTSHVYISHLHSDHYDPAFILSANLVDKIFIIKKFSNSILKRRLQSIGILNILEIDSFETSQITKKTSISIVPQMTSNSIDASDLIDYELDSSIIINCDGITFFNQVDNPLSAENYKIIKKFISDTYGRLEIACLTCGAASEYPQCFLKIDRATEKRKIISNSLNRTKGNIEILEPEYTFIAGGTYFIPGKFSALNEYIAHPSFKQLKDELNEQTRLISLEGGLEFNFTRLEHTVDFSQVVVPVNTQLKHSIESHKMDLYQHQNCEINTFEALTDLFNKAKINYFAKITKLKIKLTTEIIFKIYDDLRISGDQIIDSNPAFILQIAPSDEEINPSAQLVVHIDNQAIFRCLIRAASWNQTVSGSICLFERSPNIFEPELIFSLNYLTV